MEFSVDSIREIETIIVHLNKFPLITKKHADFVLFKTAELISNKEHLTEQGLNKIIALKSS